MRSESLRNLITLQQLTTVQDEIGQPAAAWVDVASVRADIRFLGGLETLQAGAQTSLAKASVRIRYRTNVTAGMRVVHAGATYNITAVLPDLAKKEHVDLTCEAVT